jgi:hypothetical protein
MKIFSNLPGPKAIGILEDARIGSQYQSLPLKDIKQRTVACGCTGQLNGSYIECWAVHQITKKFKNCCVLAQNNEGAKSMMEKYLVNRCHVEPEGYVLFIGVESHQAFWDYRYNNIEPVQEYSF